MRQIPEIKAPERTELDIVLFDGTTVSSSQEETNKLELIVPLGMANTLTVGCTP